MNENLGNYVYIVTGHDYSDYFIIDIFSNEETAQKCADEHNRNNKSLAFRVEKWEVNKQVKKEERK